VRSTVPHSEYMINLLEDLRKANRQAEHASDRWTELSDKANARMDRQGIKETWQRVEDRKKDIDLTGAFDEWHFWQRESVRLSSTITAEYHARQMVVGVGRT